ncbi:MAG: hypothetical protein CVV51_14230 [Spirochaetae bacterium HGW-Spirochaetae-7]|nr:MAG: hypothetical protein CVV51_14230 [Spirochaetae bacterium HGW-Spirochaetae-7]
MSEQKRGVSRRDFGKAAAAVSFAAWTARQARAEVNTDTLKIGIIGCGGRGTGAVIDHLRSNDNVVLVGVADVFQDKIDNFKGQLGKVGEIASKVAIEDDRCFLGFDAYQKLLATDIDIVIQATTPYIRPIHVAAAVDAGKHIFTEKPAATDPNGIRTFIAAAKSFFQEPASATSVARASSKRVLARSAASESALPSASVCRSAPRTRSLASCFQRSSSAFMKASAAARASSRSALTAALSEVSASDALSTRSLMAKRWASTWAVSLSSWSCRRTWVSASLARASSDQVLSVSARAASASRIDEASRSSISVRHSAKRSSASLLLARRSAKNSSSNILSFSETSA